jgi:hypothetical protein
MSKQTALLVNVVRTWPRVLKANSTMSAADAVLGDWGQLPDDTVLNDVAVVIGVAHDEMVAAFDVTSWTRLPSGRVRFQGVPSTTWAHLVGAANPGWSFSRLGVARSAQPIPLARFSANAAPVEAIEPDIYQAMVQGFVLTVTGDSAVLQVPKGRSVTIQARG